MENGSRPRSIIEIFREIFVISLESLSQNSLLQTRRERRTQPTIGENVARKLKSLDRTLPDLLKHKAPSIC